MPKLFVSVRDLEDPDGPPIIASTDQEVVEGLGRLIAVRLRARVIQRLRPDADNLLDLVHSRNLRRAQGDPHAQDELGPIVTSRHDRRHNQ